MVSLYRLAQSLQTQIILLRSIATGRLVSLIPVFAVAFCSNLSTAAPTLKYTLLKQAPHDSNIFTQGFSLDNNVAIESSGLYNKSFIRRYSILDETLLEEVALPKNQFAEGLTLVDSHIYLLTWKAQTLYVLNKNSLKPLYKKKYHGEGWGLAYDGKQLIMSNGSPLLTFRNKNTFEIEREVQVSQNGKVVSKINELEYAHNSIWANVWQHNSIFKIDPTNGKVIGELDLSDLVKQNGSRYRRVLNGIAFDKNSDAFWVTGKYWPNKYLIKIEHNQNTESAVTANRAN